MIDRYIWVGCVSCVAIISASQASAQEVPSQSASADNNSENGGLVEIVVVAQKRAENLQRVPITITAVAPQALENAGIQSTQDLAAVLPGLQILNIANSLTPRVRGVGTQSAVAGIESPIATFVDDVYHASGADIDMDFADVEQIALLKGPQGTLFGRNATGGVLRITTRQPSLDFNGSFETSFDNYLTSRSNAFVTGGLSDDIAASLSVSYTIQGKGYGTNFATGHDQYKIDSAVGARAKLRTFLTNDTTINLEGDYFKRKGPMSSNFRAPPGFSSVLPTPQLGDPWDGNRSTDTDTSVKGGGISAKLEHNFDFATFTGITAYRDVKSYYRFEPIPTAEIANEATNYTQSKQFTQEMQLISPSSGRLTWAVGAFYYYNNADVYLLFDFYNSVLYAPFKQLIQVTNQITKSVAGFAQATYAVTDSTRFTAGIRYTYDKREFSGNLNATLGNGASLLIPRVDDVSIKKPTWRLAVDQDLAQNVLLYASYNRGMKSGGFNTGSISNPPFDAEELDAYEVGLKSEFLGRRVRLNIGGFYYDYKNIQTASFGITGVNAILNAASAENYGIDADLQAKVTDDLNLTVGANWQHARFKSFPRAPIAIPKPNNEGSTTIIGDASGNTLPFSPAFTYTLGVNYVIRTDSGDITLNVNDNYNSGFYTESDNVLHQGSYHFLNASIAWQSSSGNYTARLFMNNILNEAVMSQAVSPATGYIADYSNPPRIVGASFKLRF